MNPWKLSASLIFIILISTIAFPSSAQWQTSGLPTLEETARSLQRYDKSDSLFSFCIRPIYPAFFKDSISRLGCLRGAKKIDSLPFINHSFILLPIVLQQQYNTHHPYGRNDGPMIPAKGYQSQLSFGFTLNKLWFSLQLRPELVYAQNSAFSTFPSQHSDSIWKSYYQTVLNVIDAPERFGEKTYFKLFPGQSYFRLNYRKLSLGISTENLWWGPGTRNSLLMSNNAPGFPHLSLNSSQPLTSSIGSFEWQLISGKIYGSGILPNDTSRKFDGQPLYIPKKDGDRYLNGLILTWQPKWTRGLFIGFSRVFYQYLSEVPSSVDGYLPVIGKFFKKKLPDEDEKKRDQMLSFFFRLVLAKEKAELYGEFGRNDHSLDIRDLLDEPEHSRAYILGFAKTFEGKKKNLELFSEITNLQMPSTIRLRAQESWYAHYQVQQGYTNRGQVIGAGIGPGGASQIIGLNWQSGLETIGSSLERVVHNNDFYYNAFTPAQEWQRHWVDLSLNLNKTFLRKRILYDARLSYIYSLNYQWYHKDASNLSARLSIAYLF
jgi:Capsule assembly protein Wzi